VIIFEELGVPYKATYLDFGSDKGGVEHEDFLKRNPAGRVPWIFDPTNSSIANYVCHIEWSLMYCRDRVD
jgi:glutathione S-transferase